MDELVHRFNHNFNLYSNELKLPVKISNILNNMTTDVPNLIFHGNDYIYISIVILTFMKNFFLLINLLWKNIMLGIFLNYLNIVYYVIDIPSLLFVHFTLL